MAPLRVDLDVVRAPHCVDRAVPARDRAQLRLRLPLQHLVAPVRALAVGAVGRLEHQLAAHVGHVRIGEVAHERAEGVGSPGRVRVGEGDDLASCLADGAILRRHLAAALVHEQAHAGREALDELVGAIGRGIGGDDERQLLGRVVEREQVLQPPLDHGLLVVGGDDHGHVGLDRVCADAAGAGAREGRSCERIEGVGPGERGERGPEEDLREEHRRFSHCLVDVPAPATHRMGGPRARGSRRGPGRALRAARRQPDRLRRGRLPDEPRRARARAAARRGRLRAPAAGLVPPPAADLAGGRRHGARLPHRHGRRRDRDLLRRVSPRPGDRRAGRRPRRVRAPDDRPAVSALRASGARRRAAVHARAAGVLGGLGGTRAALVGLAAAAGAVLALAITVKPNAVLAIPTFLLLLLWERSGAARALVAALGGAALVGLVFALAYRDVLGELWESVVVYHRDARDTPDVVDKWHELTTFLNWRTPFAWLVVAGLVASVLLLRRGRVGALWALWAWAAVSAAFLAYHHPLHHNHLLALPVALAVPAAGRARHAGARLAPPPARDRSARGGARRRLRPAAAPRDAGHRRRAARARPGSGADAAGDGARTTWSSPTSRSCPSSRIVALQGRSWTRPCCASRPAP